MRGFASKKIVGGKLVKVNVDCGYIINDINISGDFFMHPEEGLFEIEHALHGIHPADSVDRIERIIKETAEKHNIEMVGVDSRAMAEAIKEAIVKSE